MNLEIGSRNDERGEVTRFGSVGVDPHYVGSESLLLLNCTLPPLFFVYALTRLSIPDFLICIH